MSKIAVIDFETTGLSPGYGDRATEVAVVMIENDVIMARYQSLMNSKAPPASEVMQELAEFVGDTPFLAHNASFDSKFIDAEWSRIQHQRTQPFACSLLLSRRLYPTFHNHKLGTLACRNNCPPHYPNTSRPESQIRP